MADVEVGIVWIVLILNHRLRFENVLLDCVVLHPLYNIICYGGHCIGLLLDEVIVVLVQGLGAVLVSLDVLLLFKNKVSVLDLSHQVLHVLMQVAFDCLDFADLVVSNMLYVA